jgi:hypothetical protein
MLLEYDYACVMVARETNLRTSFLAANENPF